MVRVLFIIKNNRNFDLAFDESTHDFESRCFWRFSKGS